MRGSFLEKLAANGIKGVLCNEEFEGFAVESQDMALDSGALGGGEANIDEPHGFFRRAARRSGNSRRADAEVRATACADTFGHFPRDLFAHRTMFRQGYFRHTDQAGLR